MKYLTLLLVALCFGCKQEEPKPKIEIYLLKERVEPYEGVPILEAEEFYTIKEEIIEAGLAQARYDTVKNEFIYAGKYHVSRDDLQDEAFIANEEIILFDHGQDFIKIDSVAAMRVHNIKPNFRGGVQFVITVDREPVLTGYFWNIFSSFWCNTFHVHYIYSRQFDALSNSKFTVNTSLNFVYGPIQHNKMENKPPYPPELIEAFRVSRRLIE